VVYDAVVGQALPRLLDATVSLTRGSILVPVVNNQFLPPDVVETPKGNRIDFLVDRLTGRAKAQQLEVK